MAAFIHPPLTSVALHQMLAALADPIRLQIVKGLRDAGEGLNCTAAAAPFADVPKSTLSGHFRVLRECGIIETTKRGTENINVLRWRHVEARFPGLMPLVLGLLDR